MESAWAKMLEDKALLQEADSRDAEMFRLRFRVPYKIYELLVEWTKNWREYSDTNPEGVKPSDACGNPRIPTELLVLGVLRILGRGTCLDGIYELSGISTTSMDQFFHLWTEKFRTEVFLMHVKMPETKEEISIILGILKYFVLIKYLFIINLY